MTVRAEVWGLSADDRGIWLISGGDAWRSGPIDAESDPHYAAQEILSEHNALGDAKIVHSTSWRCEDTSIMLTYVAALDCPHVHDHWPASQLVSLMLPESVGEPLTHGADQPPTPRYVDVLLHAVRHLRFLLDYDATAAAAFSPAWRSHLMAFSPALAGMYAGEHEPEVMRHRLRGRCEPADVVVGDELLKRLDLCPEIFVHVAPVHERADHCPFGNAAPQVAHDVAEQPVAGVEHPIPRGGWRR